MIFKTLQDYINAAAIIPEARANNNTNCPAVFMQRKPPEIEADTFICIRFRQLQSVIQHYSVDLRIYAKDLATLYDKRKALIDLLDFKNSRCLIPKIQKFVFANEGGVYYDDNNFYFADSLTFDCFAKNLE